MARDIPLSEAPARGLERASHRAVASEARPRRDAASEENGMDRAFRAAESEARAASDAESEARAAAQKAPEESVDWQRLWLTTLRSPWRSLGLVPIGAGVRTLLIAAALAEVGKHHPGGTLIAHDATEVSLPTLTAELAALVARARSADRSVVALPPLLESPAGIALARAVDALILCISLGDSAIAEAEQVLAEVGRDRVLGCVIIHERKAIP
ncbi:MAG: hypothetical protein U0441_25600 [Polyangiaceae bacterium]